MKFNVKQLTLCFFVASATFVIACNKKKCNDPYNHACENYDPCFKAKPNAEFVARQSCWNSFGGAWNEEGLVQAIPCDTIDEDNVDFVPIHGSQKIRMYEWKFDGSSKIYRDSMIKNAAFYTFYHDPSNMADSIFTKPLGINYRVSTAPSSCSGNDTVATFRREITFANREMVWGEFRGIFSNNPNDSITIGISIYNNQVTEKGWFALINWPFFNADTAFYNTTVEVGWPSVKAERVHNSYNRYKLYDFDLNKPINYSLCGGLVGIDFFGRMGKSGKNEVVITCKHKPNQNAPITEIKFKGYQVRPFFASIVK
jgi:hypothetical protein